ncbi:hypothetical protein BVX94_03605 [bacterium B17]|nr:hypothetical protein BVX94_03605 [bacterium B17]
MKNKWHADSITLGILMGIGINLLVDFLFVSKCNPAWFRQNSLVLCCILVFGISLALRRQRKYSKEDHEKEIGAENS